MTDLVHIVYLQTSVVHVNVSARVEVFVGRVPSLVSDLGLSNCRVYIVKLYYLITTFIRYSASQGLIDNRGSRFRRVFIQKLEMVEKSNFIGIRKKRDFR